MFRDCSSLTSIDLSSFKNNNTTDMRYMFCGCSSLNSIDLSNLNCDKIKKESDMDYMFILCDKLKSQNIKYKDSKIREQIKKELKK